MKSIIGIKVLLATRLRCLTSVCLLQSSKDSTENLSIHLSLHSKIPRGAKLGLNNHNLKLVTEIKTLPPMVFFLICSISQVWIAQMRMY